MPLERTPVLTVPLIRQPRRDSFDSFTHFAKANRTLGKVEQSCRIFSVLNIPTAPRDNIVQWTLFSSLME